MALANFFEKVSLGASQILENYSGENFKKILLSQRVAIVYSDNAYSTYEGKIALELLVRLSARLYPNLQIHNLSKNKEFNDSLQELAKSINPKINLSTKRKPTVSLIAGKIGKYPDGKRIFLGSDGWVSKFSLNKQQGFNQTTNPFGASAAACFASSNLFRLVFKNHLPKGQLDDEFTFSVLTLEKDPVDYTSVDISNVNIGTFHLVGLGAIGNGVTWILKHLDLEGQLHLIDKEVVDLSNLQRYILCDQSSYQSQKPKVELMKAQFNSKLEVTSHRNTWEEFINARKDFKIEKVGLCVDSAKDRVAVQGALPKQIWNSWTQQESIGVSRHFDFLSDPCVSCLYLPETKTANKSELIASSLGITEQERIVRDYLAEEKRMDIALLQLISQARGIDITKLTQFEGLYLDEFYSKVICGGILMEIEGSSKNNSSVEEVPSAFESVMAGILLAAEIVIQGLGVERNVDEITSLNMMRPISKYINEGEKKHISGNCICQDPVYQEVYKSKWLGQIEKICSKMEFSWILQMI